MKEEEGGERMRGDDNQQEGIFSYISPREACSGGSSTAAHPQAGGRDSEGNVAWVAVHLYESGTICADYES
jgi:hypothetical protein